MPLYDYTCTSCDHIWEVSKKMTDPNPAECPNCKSNNVEKYWGETKQLVQYKGKGWFKTDGKY
jgi:putative FmdB family regulatory protein